MGLIIKIITWLKANGASVLALVQALIKAIKELLTAVVNLLDLFMPIESAQAIVDKIRAVLNAIDSAIEVIKKWLLQI